MAISELLIRPIDRDSEAEIALAAERMRQTLIEVLGETVGAEMYSMNWLVSRVRWHLDPAQCTGEVFLAELDGSIVGHAIVRVETEPPDTGLFSTFYVMPAARRRGVADALIRRGEAWFAKRAIGQIATNTSETNHPLIALLARHDYAITATVPERKMVHLSKFVRSST